uniref:Phosphoribulokinase/uridine kinase domain-containing protein n=1 Tax=Oryza brachyantha TaxID=4533 RepID=J3N1P6_ORYBR
MYSVVDPGIPYDVVVKTGYFKNRNYHAVVDSWHLVIFEGVYTLHPSIRKSLDLWIAVLRFYYSNLEKTISPVSYQDILKVVDATKVCSSVQNFTDVYLRLPGIPLSGQLTEGKCIRPIREGNFIIQPKVDFDISASTVAGLLKLGSRAFLQISSYIFIF